MPAENSTLTAPTSTPVPEPKSTPAPPTPTPPAPDSGAGAEDFSEFDSARARLRGEPVKPKEEKKTEPEAKPDPEQPDDAKLADKPKDDKASTAPKALREQLEKVTKEHKETLSKVAEYEKKIQEAEAKGKDTTVLAEKLAAVEKERDDFRAEIRALKQEASPEFKEKFDKPFNQAAAIAQNQIQRLTVTDPTTGESRRAEWKDFVSLYESAARDDGVIDFEKAEAMFGKGYGVATQHLTKLLELNQQRQMAFQEEKAGWEAKAKEREAQEVQRQEAGRAMRDRVFKELAEKNPDFQEDEQGDPEGTKLLKEGKALIATQPRSDQEHALLNAQIFHRASAYDRLKHVTAKQAARIAELEAKVEEFKGSGPGKTKRDGDGGAPPAPKDMWTELRELGLDKK